SRTRTGDLLGAIQPSSHVERASFAALYGRAPGVPQHLPQQCAPRLAEARDPGQVCRRHRKGTRASTFMVRRGSTVRVRRRATRAETTRRRSPARVCGNKEGGSMSKLKLNITMSIDGFVAG